MEKKKFLRFLFAIAAVILTATGCLDESFVTNSLTPNPDPDPNPDGSTVTLVKGSSDIKHEWKYSNTLVSDVVTSIATLEHDNGKEIREEQINQLLPFEIKWKQPNEMIRGTKVFTLQEKNFGEAILSGTENNDNIILKTFKQNFSFVFDGMEIEFETSYQTDSSKYEGIKLPNCILDEIVYVDQKAETIEKYNVNERPFIRSKITFTFDVKRHHTHDNSTHTDKIYPYIIVSAPEKVEPGEDIFNGAVIIAGTEKLFFNRKVDANTNIYTSQVDVWEFWTVSGKKRTTYSTELEIKHWIDDAKEPWIVPNIEFGYPNFKEESQNISEDYVKENISDYVFRKTTSEWVATWSYANNYQIGVHGSSEKAWKTYLNAKIVEMPSDLHEFYYDKYTYSDYTEKVSGGKTYLSYPSMIYFNALYNGDAYKLNQSQEFWVDKDAIDPPAPKDEIESEKIIYELENNNGSWISKIIFRRIYSQSGQRDSIATQILQRATEIDDNKQFVRPNNMLNLKNTLDPVKISENTKTDTNTGHVISTIVNRHSFDFDFFTFNIKETYQTAYTMYKGERLEFLAPIPNVILSGQTPKDKGQIVEGDGTKYNRTEYTLNFKETYGNFIAMYYPLIDIDVKDDSKPETDDIISWSFDREREGFDTKVILHITRKLSGTNDSIVPAIIAQSSTIAQKQSFYCKDNSLRLEDASSTVQISEETKNGITYVTTTTTNRFKYDISNIDGNEYVDVVTTTDVTAYMYFQGTRIDFLAPETSKVSYSGSTPADKGEVIGNGGKKYNLTTYTHSYKEVYDGKTETLTNTVDLYVEPDEVIRTEWKVLNEGLEKVSNTQWRSYFTLYEKFSDGTEKNTDKETLLNIYIQTPSKRNLQLNSAEFDYTSLIPKSVSSSTRPGGQNITITTLQAPYDLVYTSKKNEAVSSKFIFVSETAVYKDGEIEIPFKSASWEMIQSTGYSAPLQGIVGNYNRYNAKFNISGQYNGVTYPATALIDIDVLIPEDPDIPDEIGRIDIEKTKLYGGLAWSWKTKESNPKESEPFISGTIITEYGVISYWEGGYCFNKMDTNIITDRLGNALKSEGPEYLIPTYIKVLTATNKHWGYQDVNGKFRAEINGSYIMTLPNVNIDKPFIAEGDDATVYKITENGSTVRVVIVYNGKPIFDHTFAGKK